MDWKQRESLIVASMGLGTKMLFAKQVMRPLRECTRHDESIEIWKLGSTFLWSIEANYNTIVNI